MGGCGNSAVDVSKVKKNKHGGTRDYCLLNVLHVDRGRDARLLIYVFHVSC